MKTRCYNKNCKRYESYGGRGIKVCDEWLNNPKAFYNWAINNGYKKGLSIERIDNNGNYEPKNCKWITMKEQMINTRRNVLLTYKGITKGITEWAKITGISNKTIKRRLKRGYTVEQAFEIKYMKKGGYKRVCKTLM